MCALFLYTFENMTENPFSDCFCFQKKKLETESVNWATTERGMSNALRFNLSNEDISRMISMQKLENANERDKYTDIRYTSMEKAKNANFFILSRNIKRFVLAVHYDYDYEKACRF